MTTRTFLLAAGRLAMAAGLLASVAGAESHLGPVSDGRFLSLPSEAPPGSPISACTVQRPGEAPLPPPTKPPRPRTPSPCPQVCAYTKADAPLLRCTIRTLIDDMIISKSLDARSECEAQRVACWEVRRTLGEPNKFESIDCRDRSQPPPTDE